MNHNRIDYQHLVTHAEQLYYSPGPRTEVNERHEQHMFADTQPAQAEPLAPEESGDETRPSVWWTRLGVALVISSAFSAGYLLGELVKLLRGV